MTDIQAAIKEEVRRVLLGVADEMQSRHQPRDTMTPMEWYAESTIWWAAEGIRNHYGHASPPPYPHP